MGGLLCDTTQYTDRVRAGVAATEYGNWAAAAGLFSNNPGDGTITVEHVDVESLYPLYSTLYPPFSLQYSTLSTVGLATLTQIWECCGN